MLRTTSEEKREMSRGWKPRVIIEFEEQGLVKREQYDQSNLTEALTALNASHPHLGPKNIKGLSYRKGEIVVTYRGWQRLVRSTYGNLPFSEYLEVYKSDVPDTLTEDQIYLPCPRCHQNIGHILWSGLAEKDINLFFEVKTPRERFALICPKCGSEIGAWVLEHLNAGVRFYQDVFGLDPEDVRLTFANFQNTLFQLLVEYLRERSRNGRILLLRGGFLGEPQTQKSTGARLSLSAQRIQHLEAVCLLRLRLNKGLQKAWDINGRLRVQELEMEIKTLKGLLSGKQVEIDKLNARLKIAQSGTRELEASVRIMDLPVVELGLSKRTLNAVYRALNRHNLGRRVQDLLSLTEDDLLRTSGFGKKTFTELQAALAIYGLKLRGE